MSGDGEVQMQIGSEYQPGRPGDGRSDGSGYHQGSHPKGHFDPKGRQGKGYGKDWSGKPKGTYHKGKPDRFDQMAAAMSTMAEAIGKLTVASTASTEAASSSSKKKVGSNPEGNSYSNAKRSLQKKRSALLKLFDISADSTFNWEEEFPDTAETRGRIERIRNDRPEAFDRLVKGIRSVEEKVSSRKIDPANGREQPLQVLPKCFGQTEAAQATAA